MVAAPMVTSGRLVPTHKKLIQVTSAIFPIKFQNLFSGSNKRLMQRSFQISVDLAYSALLVPSRMLVVM